MDKKAAEKMTYEWYSARRLKYIKSCVDPETLHLCAFNYNWANGFDEPKAYLSNPNCSLSTALQLFYDADGLRLLYNDLDDDELPEWEEFITMLRDRIVAGDFKPFGIKFNPSLSAKELFELKKILKDDEKVFITAIEGIDCNIQI
ncbi:MAG: DUF4274 domain-containing protein [Lachnospiraceae bacterium]|nr:DUF4274 domain-containing protein [Lachnospiraceae bacterium]